MANGFNASNLNGLSSLLGGMGGSSSGLFNMLGKVNINQVMAAWQMFSKFRGLKNSLNGFAASNGSNGANGSPNPNGTANTGNINGQGGQNNMIGNILQSFMNNRAGSRGIPNGGNAGGLGNLQSMFSGLMNGSQGIPQNANIFSRTPMPQPFDFSSPIFTANPLNQLNSFFSGANYSPWDIGNMMGPFDNMFF